MNFIQQAYKGKNDWWRYLLTMIMVFIGWQVIGMIPLFAVAWSNVNSMDELIIASQDAFSSIGINSSLLLFVIILSFLIGLIALLFSVKFIHVRKIKTLITSRNNVDWKRVIYGFSLWFLISTTMIAIDYFINSDHYIWNFNLVPFVILLFVSFL
ncbi:MAG: CPBP family intramembrane metalloprotease domain-containing protein, partial [Flavobacteriaceae bacterium]|nr:CPBP family intramembrane metalloprotease domain-containing protein [Flavobacteriaceae bacterium]